jgi:hypothetical protein
VRHYPRGPPDVYQSASYPEWLAWLCSIHTADARWPQGGAGIEYSYRWGPLTLRGRAVALDAHPLRHLRICWKHQLLGDSIAELTLEQLQASACVRVTERSTGMFIGMTTIPLLDALGESKYASSLARRERSARRRASSCVDGKLRAERARFLSTGRARVGGRERAVAPKRAVRPDARTTAAPTSPNHQANAAPGLVIGAPEQPARRRRTPVRRRAPERLIVAAPSQPAAAQVRPEQVQTQRAEPDVQRVGPGPGRTAVGAHVQPPAGRRVVPAHSSRSQRSMRNIVVLLRRPRPAPQRRQLRSAGAATAHGTHRASHALRARGGAPVTHRPGSEVREGSGRPVVWCRSTRSRRSS